MGIKKTQTSAFERIYEVVREIPRGAVMTYGAVAARAGLSNGARQVGYAMRAAPDGVPWQRVIGHSRKDFGRISIRDPMIADLQREILQAEGVEFVNREEIDLARYSETS
jgi:methylated-DNA-protein-cysteine methyltransferase-like protein